MASPQERKTNSKALAAIIIAIVIVSLTVVAAQYSLTTSQTQNNLPDTALKIVGSNGSIKALTEADIQALQPYTAQGAPRSDGVVGSIATYTGVPVTDLVALVGEMQVGETLTVTSKDGYSNVYSYNQVVNGQDFKTYSADGNTATATQPLKLVLIYNLDGAALGIGEGPLMIGVLNPEGLATDGNQWAKMVVKLTVNPIPSASSQPTAKPAATATTEPTTGPSASPAPSVTLADCQVTIIGADNTSITLNKEDLLAYTATSGQAGKYRSDKGIFDYGTYQGVPITTLLDKVGGFQSSQVLSVKAADGYVKNYTYGQVIGTELTMYDPATLSVVNPEHPVTTILAYAFNGTSANLETFSGDGKTFLMISFVGEDGYATIANQFARFVTEIRIYDA
ncbi:MAG: hypothetical protein ACM3UY_02690 [Methanocella sp.]|jgi:hypothetical protein